MSRRDNWEAEDGMGFAGLVPTAAEKSQERYEAQREKRWQDKVASLTAELASLRARCDAAEKDAERYRFIRSADCESPFSVMHDEGYGALFPSFEDLDTAIDAALTAERAKEGETRK